MAIWQTISLILSGSKKQPNLYKRLELRDFTITPAGKVYPSGRNLLFLKDRLKLKKYIVSYNHYVIINQKGER